MNLRTTKSNRWFALIGKSVWRRRPLRTQNSLATARIPRPARLGRRSRMAARFDEDRGAEKVSRNLAATASSGAAGVSSTGLREHLLSSCFKKKTFAEQHPLVLFFRLRVTGTQTSRRACRCASAPSNRRLVGDPGDPGARGPCGVEAPPGAGGGSPRKT